MISLLAPFGVAVLCLGGLLMAFGLRRTSAVAAPSSPSRWQSGSAMEQYRRRQQAVLLTTGVAIGAAIWLFSGWLVAILLVPAALTILPGLLRAPDFGASIDRLEAMEEWTRNLAGLLAMGSLGLEQAMLHSAASAPGAIREHVLLLAARLRSAWTTEKALRAFAEDLDDATGDLIAATLILGVRRRGPGLANVLEGLAQTVSEEVQIRRVVETDRAKPRATARALTILTLVVLGVMSFNTEYIAPYGTALGQVLLFTLLSAYAGALLWMRRMSAGVPTPRFLPPSRPRSVVPVTPTTSATSRSAA